MILLFFIAKYFDVFKIVNNLIIDMKKNRNLEIIKTLMDQIQFVMKKIEYIIQDMELFKNQLIFS